jgi:ribulose-phosphate 3-epimerase
MASSVQIAPSLLAANFSALGDEIQALDRAKVDLLHLDVMDGHFVPNLTFGPPLIETLRPLTKLPFDAHLMITNADQYLETYAKAGCNWLSVHAEACPDVTATIHKIKSLGMKAGVALQPPTPVSSIEKVLKEVDYVLVMSVFAGFGGQKFMPESLEKVRELRKKRPDLLIEIDGGIKKDNMAEVVKAGANILVMGTGFFSLKDYSQAMVILKQAVQ